MERLRDPTIPILGESARGLFARACGNHNIPHSWMVLQHAGASFRNRVDISESDNVDLDVLGHILKVDAGELRARTYPLVSSRRRCFFGIELSDFSFETRTRRFSPAALRISSHMRAAWEIRDLPYCIEGWDLLQTHCRCGFRQGWTRITKVDRCDDCGRPLVSRVEPTPVPTSYRAALSLPALLLSPLKEDQDRGRAMLPDQLARQERSPIYGTITGFGEALAPVGKATDWERLEALHVVTTAITAWPKGIDDIGRPVGVSQRRWGQLMASYYGLGVQVASETCVQNLDVELVGIRKAVALASTSRHVLLKARDARLLTKHVLRIPGRGPFMAFDVAELKRFSRDYSARLSIQEFAKSMGLPLYAAEQIVATGRLPMDGISLAGEERFISRTDYSAFIQHLVDAQSKIRARRASSVLIPIRLASQWYGGRLKPWGRIFEAMLVGEVRFVLESGTSQVIHRISIHLSDLSKFRRLAVVAAECNNPPSSKTIHKQDALEILNIAGDTPVLIGLPFSQRGGKLYELKAVLDRAAKTITLPEIAQRTGWSVSQAFHEMLSRKVPLLFEGCWCRKEAQKHLPPPEE